MKKIIPKIGTGTPKMTEEGLVSTLKQFTAPELEQMSAAGS